MISRENFVQVVLSGRTPTPAESQELDLHFEAAAEAACQLVRAMPGIGFLSVNKRLNAFFAVCRHIDHLIDAGQIDATEGQLSILIMRVGNQAFKKACMMFDLRANRFDVEARVEMPRSARQYLAGIQAFG
jgi:hypothetical protein